MQTLLLNALLPILRGWFPAFSQQRSAERAIEQALGSLLSLGRRTLSRALWALGRQDRDWGADYKLHSRANWEAQDLFQPILEQASRFCDDSVLVVAMDDTRIRKTGRKILTAFYQRDPLSPKFRFNLLWGLSSCRCIAPMPRRRRARCPCAFWKCPPSRNLAKRLLWLNSRPIDKRSKNATCRVAVSTY